MTAPAGYRQTFARQSIATTLSREDVVPAASLRTTRRLADNLSRGVDMPDGTTSETNEASG